MNKGSIIEYIENIYGLASNYLMSNNNLELRKLLNNLELLEDKIKLCNDIDKLKNYNILVNDLISKIEGFVNE